MAEMADIFRACGQAYWDKYGENMLPNHKRAMCDIVRCRTEALGGLPLVRGRPVPGGERE